MQIASFHMDETKYLIVGVGNILLEDEGLGPEVVKFMQGNYLFPDNVDIVDCATLGMSMLGIFRDYDYIVVVDAVDGTGMESGTVFKFGPDDLARRNTLPSAHDIRLADVVDAARAIGYQARCECIGVQVEQMSPEEFYIGLTPKVREAVPVAARAAANLAIAAGACGIVEKGAES